MNRITAALIAACVTLPAIAFSAGTYAAPINGAPHVRTVERYRYHDVTIHTLPECGVEGDNGVDADDDCILPADKNDTDPNGPFAGETLIIHNGDVYTYDSANDN